MPAPTSRERNPKEIVPAGHTVFANELTVLEIKRILEENLRGKSQEAKKPRSQERPEGPSNRSVSALVLS